MTPKVGSLWVALKKDALMDDLNVATSICGACLPGMTSCNARLPRFAWAADLITSWKFSSGTREAADEQTRRQARKK